MAYACPMRGYSIVPTLAGSLPSLMKAIFVIHGLRVRRLLSPIPGATTVNCEDMRAGQLQPGLLT